MRLTKYDINFTAIKIPFICFLIKTSLITRWRVGSDFHMQNKVTRRWTPLCSKSKSSIFVLVNFSHATTTCGSLALGQIPRASGSFDTNSPSWVLNYQVSASMWTILMETYMLSLLWLVCLFILSMLSLSIFVEHITKVATYAHSGVTYYV